MFFYCTLPLHLESNLYGGRISILELPVLEDLSKQRLV
jgi:hypothetical protein